MGEIHIFSKGGFMAIQQKEINKLKNDLINSLKYTNVIINDNQIDIINCGCPHQTSTLPKNKMAVYAFFYKNECLKIGKVGPNSNARYNSQHYNPESSRSNLAKSILSDKYFSINNIKNDEIGDWIKENTQRINIILDKNIGILTLGFIESFAILYYKPRYEGFENQR
jgi:hypothetical protein